jgi:glycosyltransferase involved in cell wall biosynthesis
MGEADDLHAALRDAPPNVILTGHLPRGQVFDRLLDSDVFVFPSRREGSPNAVLEAMAAGLPVVATRTGGLPDMVTDGEGGYLVPSRDVDALTSAVRRLAADRELAVRMGAHNRAVCAERFAFSIVFGRLSAIYETALSETPITAGSIPLPRAAPASGPGIER